MSISIDEQMNSKALKTSIHRWLTYDPMQPFLENLLDHFLVGLIIVNVLALVLETVVSFYTPLRNAFWGFEVGSFSIFLIEYSLRIWICNEFPPYNTQKYGRWRYIISFLSLSESISLLAFAGWLFFPTSFIWANLLRFCRLFLIFKLIRYSDVLRMILTVIKQKREPLLMTILITLISMLLSAILVYIFENPSYPENFPNLFTSMYWAGMNLLTTGYGDIIPQTIAGKIAASFIAFLGIGLFALLTSIIGRGFSEELNQFKLLMRKCPRCGWNLRSKPKNEATMKNENQPSLVSQENRQSFPTYFRVQRFFAYLFESKHPTTRAPKIVFFFFFILIVLNAFVLMLETNETLYKPYEFILYPFEVVSIIVFSIEYIIRVWIAPLHENPRFHHPIKGRILYMLTFLALVDVISVLPFYLDVIFGENLIVNELVFLRLFRLVRVFHVFEVGHFSSELDTIVQVITSKKRELYMITLITFTIVVFVSTLMYFAEREAQPEVFSSIPMTMWWGINTITTLGSGDMVPITSSGRFLAIIAAFIGVGIYALAAGIISAAFIDYLKDPNSIKKCPRCNKII